ncbi:MAG: Phage/plasmid-like protein, partial [Gemmatimonadales bacterium]|nr:Phage/plasmid-like protein [Gemmatimonadales bacterium]
AAYNAVTAMLDHHSKVTGKRDPDLVRAERALTDDHPTAKIKTRAFELLRTP